MRGDRPDQGNYRSSSSDRLSSALSDAWESGNTKRFCGVVIGDAIPRLERHLLRMGLTEDDACECADEAIVRVLEVLQTRSADVTNPYAYLFRTGINVANDLLRERKNYSDIVASSELPPTSQISSIWAESVVYDAIDEAEPEATWALPVVRLALSRLPVNQRAVLLEFAAAEFLVESSRFDITATIVGTRLGMQPAAVRKAKERGLGRLREEVRFAASELGLVLPPRVESAVFSDES